MPDNDLLREFRSDCLLLEFEVENNLLLKLHYAIQQYITTVNWATPPASHSFELQPTDRPDASGTLVKYEICVNFKKIDHPTHGKDEHGIITLTEKPQGQCHQEALAAKSRKDASKSASEPVAEEPAAGDMGASS